MNNNIVPPSPQEYDPPVSPTVLGYAFRTREGYYSRDWDKYGIHSDTLAHAEIYSWTTVVSVCSKFMGWGNKRLGHWVVVYEQVS